MSFIAIPGGGGKTTLAQKYLDKFLDLDEFIWSEENQEYHSSLIYACQTKNIDKISEIYTEIYQKKERKN